MLLFGDGMEIDMNKKLVLFMVFLCYNSITTVEASGTDTVFESESESPFEEFESIEEECSESSKELDFIETHESESESVYPATVESKTVLQQPETDLENGILDFFNEAEMEAAWNSLFATDNFIPSSISEADMDISLDARSEMDEVKSIKNGEVLVVDYFSKIVQKNPMFFSSNGISYIYDSEQNEKLVIYRKNGVNHSFLISSSDNIDEKIKSFTKKIDDLYEKGMLLGNEGNSRSSVQRSTITKEEVYTDSYIFNDAVDNAQCKYETTFEIERDVSDSTNDTVIITSYNYVTPYFGPRYVTTWYRAGIARVNDSVKIYLANPVTAGTIEFNKDINIGVALGLPAAISADYNIALGVGNTLLAWLRDENTSYGENFKNLKGVSGNSEDGSFFHGNIVKFSVPKSCSNFSFQYAQLFQNSIYGNGSDPHFMGNAWKIIPASEIGMRPSTSSYVVDGLDYGLVFDPEYYLITNSDVYAAFGDDSIAAFHHFLNNGMAEARIASPTFNVVTYRNKYSDLNTAFGDDWPLYYKHYIQYGYSKGRTGY